LVKDDLTALLDNPQAITNSEILAITPFASGCGAIVAPGQAAAADFEIAIVFT
jgi:hypothetical protein